VRRSRSPLAPANRFMLGLRDEIRIAVFALSLALPAVGAEPKLSAKVEKVAVPEALAEPIRKISSTNRRCC